MEFIKKGYERTSSFIKRFIRELAVWSYTPLICATVTWVVLFFLHEAFSSQGDKAVDEFRYFSIWIFLILGGVMGAVAVGYIFKKKQGEFYLSVPVGRRECFVLKTLSLLLGCTVAILAAYALFYIYVGGEQPDFLELGCYNGLVDPSLIDVIGSRYEGTVLYAMFGLRLGYISWLCFLLGFTFGCFCSVMGGSPLVAPIHAGVLLGAVFMMVSAGMTNDILGLFILPIDFAYQGEYNLSYSLILQLWYIFLSVFYFSLSLLAVGRIKTERGIRFFTSPIGLGFYAVYGIYLGFFWYVIEIKPQLAERVVDFIVGLC